MSDLPERLRANVSWVGYDLGLLLQEAADFIETQTRCDYVFDCRCRCELSAGHPGAHQR